MDDESQFIVTFATVKLHLIIGLTMLSIFTLGYAGLPDNHIPEMGVLDLSSTVLDEDSFFSLNGEWEFYWEKLLSPDNYLEEKIKGSRILVSVPSYWQSYEIEGRQLPGFGYGTYALTVILPPNYRSDIYIEIPVFDVAYKFFLNETLVRKNGTVGTSQKTEEPWYDPGRLCYTPHNDTIQVLIQVSNFHHRRGGFWKPLYFGGPKAIINRAENHSMFSYSTMGVLLFCIIFFTIFWFSSKQNTILLLFAISALGILLRLINTGHFFSNHVVHTPWAWQIRMEYFGTYLAYMFGMLFLHRVFPKKYMEPFIKGNTIVSFLLILSVFTMPPSLFAFGMNFFLPLSLLFLTHYLVTSLIGTLHRKLKETIFFVSLALFIFTLINDILLANSAKAISATFLIEITFQLFILSMVALVILMWVDNYNTRLRLESSLRFKNKVLSVIAHDLKNPVASIAQFTDLMTTKPELAAKKEILSSLHESSQAAVTLLDNLLYWGRSQADELKVSPRDLDLGILIDEVKSLYTHMAIQKHIELTSSSPPDTPAYADKDLITIVIRNLVSNALKFTPAKGRVNIQARPQGDKVYISVSDTGIGINLEILEQFRNEGQLTSSMGTDKEIGTGLGLQLVSDLVSKNHGILEVESAPNKGSTFTFTLPLKREKQHNENI